MPTPQLPFAAAVRKAENNGVIFDCGTPTVIAGCSNKNIREIIIPDGVTAIAFDSKEKATAFEKYLKTGSGHAFAKRHF